MKILITLLLLTAVNCKAFWISSNVVATVTNGAFWIDAPQTGFVPTTNQYAPASYTNPSAMTFNATNGAPFAIKGANNFIAQNTRAVLSPQRHLIHVWGWRTNGVDVWLTNETTHSVSCVGSSSIDTPQTNRFDLWLTGSGGDAIAFTNRFTPSATVGIKYDGSEDIGL